ncbi:hypothetical protein DM02DRAFT_511120 [Periconia macrospinosa]|uniref:Rhodopsin domain-containing protein n=1 Tax=Periconia macrospinosa TaxID=97972 RepID=A0A2V1EBV5_9PLEO|nr:hypothetical protein DM02DRAFT_511120 [Periconia macrospinosa]
MNLKAIPAGKPPPSVQSNLVNPPSLLGAVIASTVVIQLLTLVFMLVRFYVNYHAPKLRIEDYCSCMAWIAFIIQAALLCLNSSRGMAVHFWDASLSTLIEGRRLCNFTFIFYTISGGFAKATVFLQFQRIFTTPNIRGAVFWVIRISLWANALAYTTFLFLHIFICWPRERIANPTVPGHCMDSNRLNMALGGLNTFSDIEAFFVPAWAVWRLHLDVKRKLSVFAVFAVGALAVAIGCLGMYYRVLVSQRPDKTWLLTQTSITCMAELSIVIIVGCCPYIPRLLQKKTKHYHLSGRNMVGTIGSNGKKRTDPEMLEAEEDEPQRLGVTTTVSAV